ncbi:ASKHA domain-containing protein [Methanoculleus sp. UBA300]|uniref:ASKHA domain-containing protein n=1 Tax=Methanoculleus sp. UBA300 TaxID=1915496 RepID=UPI00319E352C
MKSKTLFIDGDCRATLRALLGPDAPPARCGGAGVCGSCRVKLAGASALPPPSSADLQRFSAEELASGWRLSCLCVPAGRFAVEIPEIDESGIADMALRSGCPEPDGDRAASAESELPEISRFAVAVDVGTTTIVTELLDRGARKPITSDSFVNPQRKWGADVLSRIEALSRAGGEGVDAAFSMKAALAADLEKSFCRLLQKIDVAEGGIVKIGIAANTAMTHILIGLDARGLGVSPFVPAALSFPDLPARALFPGLPSEYAEDCAVTFVPCLSAFIGGDIVAGLAAAGLDPDGPPSLFLDLGTNAEMVLASGGRFLCASAAAGPAFEGGRISCGVAAVPESVAEVRLDGSRFAWKRAGSFPAGAELPPPPGLCGSGLVDFLACALDAGLVRPDGSLAPACAGGVLLGGGSALSLSSGDVRELQLARAAVRAGIGILLEEAGLSAADLERVYLAGGFGTFLKEESALRVSLIPRECRGRIIPAGNASLSGARLAAIGDNPADRFNAILEKSVPVPLGGNERFNALFIDFLEFD